MTKFKCLPLALGILFMSSCAKENPSSDPCTNPSNSETIAVSEAIQSLENVIKMTTLTKSSLTRQFSCEDVIAIGKASLHTSTKAQGDITIPDTLMYLVNFEKNQGFAIMSATTKLREDVYCITESGSLSVSDIISAFQFISTQQDIQNSENNNIIESGIQIIPSIILSSMLYDLKYGKQDEEYSTKATGATYGPYILTKWGQGHGIWNKYTPNNYAAGCVAIATSQIMLYNRLPIDPIFDGKQCNWKDMEQVYNYYNFHQGLELAGTLEQQDQVGHFVYEIGKRHNCYIRYGEDGSGGWADGAKRTLNNYGYSNVKKFLGFGKKNQKKADECLRQGYPVYLDGTGNGSGHAWVIDGLMNDSFYHINWGWEGACDGYYTKGVFNTTDRQSIDAMIDSGDVAVNQHNYTWNYRLITYSK